MIAAAGGPDSPERRQALDRFIRSYWKPLVQHAVRNGLSPEDAEDTVQTFLTEAVEGDLLARFDRTRGIKFRHFLRDCLHLRVIDARRKIQARPDAKPESLWYEDDTKRIDRGLEDHRGGDPDDGFDPDWYEQILENSMKALAEELSKEYPEDIRILQVWGLQEPKDRPPADEFIASLGLPEPLKEAALEHRARRRRKALLEEIERQVRKEFPEDADVREEVRKVIRVVFDPSRKGRWNGKPTGK